MAANSAPIAIFSADEFPLPACPKFPPYTSEQEQQFAARLDALVEHEWKESNIGLIIFVHHPR
jgi:hypothetical protein